MENRAFTNVVEKVSALLEKTAKQLEQVAHRFGTETMSRRQKEKARDWIKDIEGER